MSLRAADMHAHLVAVALDHHLPRVAADGAILDEGAGRLGIDVEVDPLTAVRAAHANRLFHAGSVAQRFCLSRRL